MTMKELFSLTCVPQIEEGVDDEQDVHGGDGDQVDGHVEHAVALLHVQQPSQQQRANKGHEGH